MKILKAIRWEALEAYWKEKKKRVYSSTFLRRTFTQFKNPFNVYFVCDSTKLGKKTETKQNPNTYEAVKYSGTKEKSAVFCKLFKG